MGGNELFYVPNTHSVIIQIIINEQNWRVDRVQVTRRFTTASQEEQKWSILSDL